MGNSAVAKVDAVMVEKAMTTRNLEVVSSSQALAEVNSTLFQTNDGLRPCDEAIGWNNWEEK
jgi:hypothetical protein